MLILKLFPGLASCSGRVDTELLLNFQSDRRYLTFRHNTSAECLKAAHADVLHKVFREDTSTRIPSAEEEDLEFLRRGFHLENINISCETSKTLSACLEDFGRN
jgi:hypothetical protein